MLTRLRRSRRLLLPAPLLLALATGCTFDAPSLDQLTCEDGEEGTVDGSRVCRDGYWELADEDLFIDMADMDDSLDAGAEDLGQIPDMGVDTRDMPELRDEGMIADMPGRKDMLPAEDMGEREDMTSPPDMMPPEDMGAPDMLDLDMGPTCPTTNADWCAQVRSEFGAQTCTRLQGPLTLANRCVTPGDLVCECMGGDLCEDLDLTPGGVGMCNEPCVPESNDLYCARVQAGRPNDDICGSGFGLPDNCGGDRSAVSCGDCVDGEQCVANVCECEPFDALNDKNTLCAMNANPCGAANVPDGCGGMITVEDCSVCGDYEACEAATLTCEPLPVQPLPAPASLAQDALFGAALATDGDWLAVGAPQDDVQNTAGNTVACGAVHMYKLENGAWSYKQKLADDRDSICNNGDEEFGFAVDIDEDRLVIGAPGDGAGGRVHFFHRSGNTWSREDTFETSFADIRSGSSVAINRISNGEYRVAVGAPSAEVRIPPLSFRQNAGVVHGFVFTRTGGNWSYEVDVNFSNRVEEDARFGSAVAWENDGQLWVGNRSADFTGRVDAGGIDEMDYISNGNMTANSSGPFSSNSVESGSSAASAFYGYAIAANPSEDWVIIGAPGTDINRGKVYFVDDLFGSTNIPPRHQSVQAGAPDDNDAFGESVDIATTIAIVGAPADDGASNNASNTGAAYVYEVSNDTWTLLYEARIPTLPVGAQAGDAVATLESWSFFGAPLDQGGGGVYVIDLSTLP